MKTDGAKRADSPQRDTAPWRELRARDRQLVAGCLRGDEEAWSSVWEHYGPLVKAVALRRGCDYEESREVLQRVALVALEGLAKLKDAAKLGGWLAGVARFQALAVIRERRGSGESIPECAAPEASHEELLMRDQEQLRVRQAMLQLDGRCRRIITRLDLHEPPSSYAEVSAEEGLAPSSIGPIRRRCLTRLRRLLEKVSR